jgi:hypothetical protein
LHGHDGDDGDDITAATNNGWCCRLEVAWRLLTQSPALPLA